ncbi:TPA: hypothetical protein ACH3X2_013947 [Trebouxia sp. C0005]
MTNGLLHSRPHAHAATLTLACRYRVIILQCSMFCTGITGGDCRQLDLLQTVLTGSAMVIGSGTYVSVRIVSVQDTHIVCVLSSTIWVDSQYTCEIKQCRLQDQMTRYICGQSIVHTDRFQRVLFHAQ